MSTILEAQRELERQRSGHSVPAPPATDERGVPRWRLFAVGAALSAVGLVTLAVLVRPVAVPPAPPAAVAAAPDPAAASARRAPAPEQQVEAPPRVGSASEATPWGRVEKKAAATPVPPLANRAAAAPPDRRADGAPGPRRAAAPAAAPAVPADRAGNSAVRLKSIHFAKVASERSVTLEIDSGRELTLRQGERAAGVEVQLILPTMVYVHQGASVFAVSLER